MSDKRKGTLRVKRPTVFQPSSFPVFTVLLCTHMCKCSQIRVVQGSSGGKSAPVSYSTAFQSCTQHCLLLLCPLGDCPSSPARRAQRAAEGTPVAPAGLQVVPLWVEGRLTHWREEATLDGGANPKVYLSSWEHNCLRSQPASKSPKKGFATDYKPERGKGSGFLHNQWGRIRGWLLWWGIGVTTNQGKSREGSLALIQSLNALNGSFQLNGMGRRVTDKALGRRHRRQGAGLREIDRGGTIGVQRRVQEQTTFLTWVYNGQNPTNTIQRFPPFFPGGLIFIVAYI